MILLFEVENISGREISDLFVGWYNELTVGNTTVTIPGSDTNGWNFYDDVNGFISPGELLDDPDARIMYCYDEDGEDGAAESWIGVRFLGTDAPEEGRRFSYRQWRFGQDPPFDDDKYQFMSSGRIDEGQIEGTNYDAVGNWVSMISVGPWETFFPEDRIHFAIAYVAGADSTETT